LGALLPGFPLIFLPELPLRYLKASLLCGLIASLFVGGLYASGAFTRLDFAFWIFLGKNSNPPAFQSALQYFMIVVLAFGVAWITIDITRPILKGLIVCALLLEVLCLPWVMNAHRRFVSPFAPSLALVFAAVGGSFYSRSEAGKRKRLLSQTFGERISRKAFYSLVNSNEPLDFSGQKREVSVLLCEIFNHEELTDSMPTPDYVTMSNLFLQTGSDFLVEHGAFLDECDGESLRVVFGAPVGDDNHAEAACEAALELASRLQELNQVCEQRWQKRFDFRIGINSAPMVLAAYGSRRLGTFSVAGEPVDFARRLCAANVVYGSRILVSSGTQRDAMKALEVRPLELIRNGEEIYELLGLKHSLSDAQLFRRDLFWKGVILFREKKWEEALQHFQAAAPADAAGSAGSGEEEDGPLQFYIRRVEQVRAGLPALQWQEARL
jgi:class 3 adenylate cyclase